jgi:hypothetical protein
MSAKPPLTVDLWTKILLDGQAAIIALGDSFARRIALR